VDPHFLEEESIEGAQEACTDEACTDEAHGHGHGHGHAHGDAAGAECAVDGCAEPSHGHGHGHEAKKHKATPAVPFKKKRHDLSGVSSVGIEAEGELDFNGLNGFMMRLLQASARDIYRSKGVLCFAGQGTAKFIFQGVHEQIHFGPSSAHWADGEKRVNKMVFIGRKLDRAALEEGFRACLVKADGAAGAAK
jgi:G3E family GTPase